MSAILTLFAQEVGAGPSRRVVLVLDGAGWHKAKNLVIPEGIHIVFLPPYSPELQPAERIWPVIGEATANRSFPTIDALVKVIEERLLYIDKARERIHALTHYHWWPADREAMNAA